MQNAIQFLEKKVEWLAVGVGALFFLWMAYLYLLSQPVSKTVGGTVITPDNVEQWIDTTSATSVRNQIANAKAPAFNVEDFSSAITSGLNLDTVKPTELADAWDYHPVPLTNMAGGPGNLKGDPVTSMPILPAAKPVLFASGQTTVMQNANANANRVDLEWITGAFLVPAAQLMQQWTSCYGPTSAGGAWKLLPTQLNTWFLSVTALRSEKLPDGGWGPEVEVKPLFNVTLQPFPAPNNRNAEAQFAMWASRQMNDIAAPAFPTQAPAPSGTIWKDPIAILQAKANPSVPLMQPGIPPGAQSGLFREQVNYGAFMTVAGPPAGGGGMGGPPSGMPRGRGMPMPPRNYQPPPPTQAPPPVVQTPVIPSQLTDPNVVFVHGAVPAIVPTTLTGSFNPGSFTKDAPDILIYFNDGSALPGKTYRYRLEYKLLNPLFNKAPEHAPKVHQEWVDQLDLTAPKSEFSPEITVPQKTYFYCAKAVPLPPSGRVVGFPFEVFTWADGLWRKQVFSAFPGDVIGGVNNTYDFSTGYTYVDGARRNGKFFVTLVDDGGTAKVLDAAKDTNSADHKTRTQWVESQNQNPTAADNGAALPPNIGAAPVPPYVMPPNFGRDGRDAQGGR